MKQISIWTIFVGILLITTASAWDTDELEIFDLVEEINENFYHVMGIQQVRSNLNIFKKNSQLNIDQCVFTYRIYLISVNVDRLYK